MDKKFVSTETTEFRSMLMGVVEDIQAKTEKPKNISWLQILSIVIPIIVSVLLGMLYIIRSENAAMQKDIEYMKPAIEELKSDVKDIKKDISAMQKGIKSEEQLKRIASEVAINEYFKLQGILNGKKP